MAEAGSGVPPNWRALAKERAECEAEEAELGTLALPSSMPKLPVRERALTSSPEPATPPSADEVAPTGNGRLVPEASCGVEWLPRGVARRNCGGAGRPDGGACKGGTPGAVALLPTGRWLGEGGMARPSCGVRAPPRRLAPGTGGRRRGAGDEGGGGDMSGGGLTLASLLLFSISRGSSPPMYKRTSWVARVDEKLCGGEAAITVGGLFAICSWTLRSTVDRGAIA